jgi:creatinine amidohydrolase
MDTHGAIRNTSIEWSRQGLGVHHLADMTWEDVRDLDLARTVAVLPLGAIEAHGPHLPLQTDVVIAEAMAESGATLLERRGYVVLILPPLPFSAAPFAAGFVGTLSVNASTVKSLIVELAAELTRHGCAALALANAHFDPAHIDSLRAAVELAAAKGLLPMVFPDVTRKTWATRLTEEFKSGACHAGRYEGSIVMAARPDLVREAVQASLEPNPQSLSTAFRQGVSTFEDAGGSRAYFGWPADASAEEGRETLRVLGGILDEAVRDALVPGESP